MSDRFNDSESAREALSALADGEAQSPEVARACAAWKDDPEARATWHAYQLIGDVMRSEDLAESSGTDSFLKNFRERMAQEPVVLVPAVAAAQKAAAVAARHLTDPYVDRKHPIELKRRTWMGPVGVAAGFVMLVGALLSTQGFPTGPAGQGSGVTMAGVPNTAVAPDLSMAAVSGPSLGNALGNALMPVSAEQGKVPEAVSGPSFSRPENIYVVIVRDPRVEHAMSAPVPTLQAPDLSFSTGQSGLVRQVVYDAR
ncbi:MAG: sigma-E factor negative regulatory protein [Aquabacterium sp.]